MQKISCLLLFTMLFSHAAFAVEQPKMPDNSQTKRELGKTHTLKNQPGVKVADTQTPPDEQALLCGDAEATNCSGNHVVMGDLDCLQHTCTCVDDDGNGSQATGVPRNCVPRIPGGPLETK